MIDLNGFQLGEGQVAALADNDQPDMDRLVSIITQQQAGMDMLTDLMLKMKSDIETMKVEIRRVKARTDAPARSSILRI